MNSNALLQFGIFLVVLMALAKPLGEYLGKVLERDATPLDRLAGPAGFSFPAEMGLAERLKIIQGRLEAGDPQARLIFESIGVYLGYALPWYAEFYDLRHVMILGRVTSGSGGDLILARAREVLALEFPQLAGLAIALPDEQNRRVGQAVAAASLPQMEH